MCYKAICFLSYILDCFDKTIEIKSSDPPREKFPEPLAKNKLCISRTERLSS